VRTTALPINSARASPYSLKILDARRVTDGIARRPCSASHRRLNDEFFSYAPQHDYGARCSNFRSRSICALSLSGWSGSGFSASPNFSAIALAMARLCLWSRSLRRGTTNLLPAPSAASPPASTAALLKEPETAAFGYLRERLYSGTAGRSSDLWLSRDMRRVSTGERRSHCVSKASQVLSFPYLIATRSSIRTRHPGSPNHGPIDRTNSTRNHF
jgi:hypothetical protein